MNTNKNFLFVSIRVHSWFRFLLFVFPVLMSFGCKRVQPPDIKTAGIDPIIATQISNTVAEVNYNRRSGTAWGKLGMVLKAAGYQSEAKDCFVRAEQLDPKDPRWPYFQDTSDSLQRAVTLKPVDFLQIRLAQSLVEAGRWSEAEKHFRGAGHSLGLAQVACAQGKWEQALPHLQQARQNKYMAQTATALLATVNLRLGRAAEARALSDEAADMPPDVKWPNPFEAELKQYAVGKREWIEQAQDALGRHDLPAAAPIIERLVKLYPNSSEGWLYLGRACVIQSNLPVAENALSRHLQLDPASVDGHLQMGLVHFRQNRFKEAAAEFEMALRSKPDSENAHYFLGEARRRLGDKEGATQAFRNALRCDPNLLPARKALDELAANR